MVGETEFHRRFGAALRKRRLDAGLSQEGLAHSAEISPRYLSDLERGRKSPSIRVVKRLADALAIRAHLLIREAEDPDG